MTAFPVSEKNKTPLPKPGHIARADRVALASSFYGLYLLGSAMTDSERIDEDCAMDNMRVPFLTDCLSNAQRAYLEQLHGLRAPLMKTQSVPVVYDVPSPDPANPENRMGVGLPYIPLTLKEGERDVLSPNGFFPPSSCMVVFRTFDGVLHNGETVEISDAGENLRCDLAFFARVKGKRVLYFTEEVKEWQIRDTRRLTEL